MKIRPPANDSIQRVVELLGDRWTILVIREAFFGVHRFSEFARNIGITNRNLLTNRLRLLVDAEIFERTDEGGGRIDYRLTARGRDLYPMMMAMMAWGDRHLADPGGPPLTLEHRSCGHPAAPVLVCEHCHEPIDPRDIDARPGPGFEPPGESRGTDERAS
ncbi:winged helix-turn-helix transcriptional regulator [Nocardia sp. NPDC057440]|uniref:winged helix-turn-helix transcriptional regulator n=1 Tax=Nocardia sp. NPDC057440 TaxID=3346134 RepID=UPI00366E3288